VHPKAVADILGHSSVAMTLDIYSHVSNGMHDRAASEMDNILTIRVSLVISLSRSLTAADITRPGSHFRFSSLVQPSFLRSSLAVATLEHFYRLPELFGPFQPYL